MQFKEALTVKPAAWMIALSVASLAGTPALADEGQAQGADAPQQSNMLWLLIALGLLVGAAAASGRNGVDAGK